MPAVTSDPLRTLAHPLRARLHRVLSLEGPATATALAARLHTNSGATSYHLRQLARAGLVVDAARPPGPTLAAGPASSDGSTPAGAPGRRRYWQAVTEAVTPRTAEVIGEPEADAALLWLERDVVAHIGEQAGRWLSEATTAPPLWRDASRTSAELVLVTATALEALRADVQAVLRRYRRQGQGSPQAKRVAVYTVCIPLDVTPARDR